MREAVTDMVTLDSVRRAVPVRARTQAMAVPVHPTPAHHPGRPVAAARVAATATTCTRAWRNLRVSPTLNCGSQSTLNHGSQSTITHGSQSTITRGSRSNLARGWQSMVLSLPSLTRRSQERRLRKGGKNTREK